MRSLIIPNTYVLFPCTISPKKYVVIKKKGECGLCLKGDMLLTRRTTFDDGVLCLLTSQAYVIKRINIQT